MGLLVLILMWVSKRLKVGLQGCSPQDRLAPHASFSGNLLFLYYCKPSSQMSPNMLFYLNMIMPFPFSLNGGVMKNVWLRVIIIFR